MACSIVALGILCLVRWGWHTPNAGEPEREFQSQTAESLVRRFPKRVSSDTALGETLVSFSPSNVSMGGLREDEVIGPDSRLLVDGPHLRKETCEFLGLTNPEVEELQTTINEMWKEMNQLSHKYIMTDPLRTESEKGVLCLRLRIPAEEGERVIRQFEKRVYDNFDNEKADRIIGAFNWDSYFGGFGRYEQFITFKTLSEDLNLAGDDSVVVIFDDRDPEFGTDKGGMTLPCGRVIELFGNLLEAVQ